jgi:hypothetical protein
VPAEGKVLVHDGVAVLARGDVLLIVYQGAARLERSRWLFDRMDELTQGRASFMALMVVLPTADPPDAPTRRENSARLKKVESRLRRLITAAVGDAFRTAIVRTVMRAIAAIHGKSGVHFVVETVGAGVTRLREAASPDTPSPEELLDDLRRMHEALGVARPA